jgi:hypothetical protein
MAPEGDSRAWATRGPGSANGDLITAGETVNIDRPIDGDVAAAGKSVTIADSVNGYVMAAGADVNIKGTVNNDVWAAGQNVTIEATVDDSLRAAGDRVTLGAGARVGETARIGGNVVAIKAPIEQDLILGATEAQIASSVGGSVHANVVDLKLLPGAIVEGDLNVQSPNPPQLAPGARVLGRVNYQQTSFGWTFEGWLGYFLFSFLALMIVGSAAIASSRWWWTARVSETIADRTAYSALIGLAALIAIPILCALLVMTLIGIPLALILLALYGVGLLLAAVFVSYRLGDWLLAKMGWLDETRYTKLGVGAAIIALLVSLPWIGWLTQFAVVITGSGALLLAFKDTWKEAPAQRVLIVAGDTPNGAAVQESLKSR